MNAFSLKLLSPRLIFGFLFEPKNGLVDWFSMFLMGGWILALFNDGETMLSQHAFTGFNSFSVNVWIFIFMAAFITHAISIIYRYRYAMELRFISMVPATCIWTFIALNFLAFAPASITAWTYGSLSLICFLLGIKIAWTSSSHHY